MASRVFSTCLQIPYRVTAKWRRLPDFLLIGAQKSGTTSLFHYLAQHSQVAVNPRKRKEIYFFNQESNRVLEAYRQYFPLCSVPGLVGDGTTVYFHSPEVPERVHHLLPKVKLVLVLREPSARALSHYYHHVQRGREKRSTEEAFSEETLLNYEAGTLRSGLSFRYLSNGDYAYHLERWLRFFPENQILVVQAERLFREPQFVVDDVVDFLGLEQEPLLELPVLNRGVTGSKSPAITFRLQKFYQQKVEHLKSLNVMYFNWEPYD